MKALSVSTLGNFKLSLFLVVLLATTSCQSINTTEIQRQPASESNQIETLLQSNPTCPKNTELKSFESRIDLEQCLNSRNYTHVEDLGRSRRKYFCSHERSKHRSILLNNFNPATGLAKSMYQPSPQGIIIPTDQPDSKVTVQTSSHFYTIMVRVDGDRNLNQTEVKQIIRSTKGLNGASIKLYRCECQLPVENPEEPGQFLSNELSINECLRRLNGPIEVPRENGEADRGNSTS